jgi:RES domain-containing protein
VRFWRLYRRVHRDPLSGEGARTHGGRWNLKGFSTLYLAESLSLCALETLARVPDLQRARGYVTAEYEIDARLLPNYRAGQLPSNWDAEPPTKATQSFGVERYRRNLLLGFRVPSVIVPNETIAVVFPDHKEFRRQVKVIRADIPFPFDPRLFRT